MLAGLYLMSSNERRQWEDAEIRHKQFKTGLGGFRFLFGVFFFCPGIWIYILLFFQEFTRRAVSR